MTAELFKYDSLANQVAARIAHDIEGGKWINSLPSERVLAQTLQVSRKTIRKSLAQLQKEGLINTCRRLGHRIVASRPVATSAEMTVGLLTPESFDRMPSYTALWVKELNVLLLARGIRLNAFSSSRFFSRGSSAALTRLVTQSPQTCWVLTHSNDAMQRWFVEHRVPCVIAGSCHHGHPLPNVDLDYYAVCRHAAGMMLRHGHRRLALLIQQSQRRGDLESEAGFTSATQKSTHSGASAVIVRHDGTAEGAWRMLGRLFDSATPPTALLVAKPAFYLTAVTFLAHRGLRVGEQVSLISRDHDTFLSYLKPAPAGYMLGPRVYAKRLFNMVLALAQGQPINRLSQYIEPKFAPGDSLAPVRR